MAVLTPSPISCPVCSGFLPVLLACPGGCLGVGSLIPTCPAARGPSSGLSLSCPATVVEMLPELKQPLGTVFDTPPPFLCGGS